jgi:hypothetical protein
MPITRRERRVGAIFAGGLLLAISITDVLLGTDNPNVVNVIMGILGAALLIWAVTGGGSSNRS